MKIPIYQVDAFADKLFGGNPAAVCPLEDWLTEEQMQKIGMENNLAETVFFVKDGADYHIRWFTPTVEVALCGHATLAAAHVLFHHLGYTNDTIVFHSKSGPLKVDKVTGGNIRLNFPADKPVLVKNPPPAIFKGLGIDPVPVFKSSFDYMTVIPSQKIIEGFAPDFKVLQSVEDCRGIIVTSKGDDVDFVSRCFFPQSGIDEDPVTGSAHTSMVPYWAEQLGKTTMKAIQLSKRRGYLNCELAGDRVYMSGLAVEFMKGEITL